MYNMPPHLVLIGKIDLSRVYVLSCFASLDCWWRTASGMLVVRNWALFVVFTYRGFSSLLYTLHAASSCINEILKSALHVLLAGTVGGELLEVCISHQIRLFCFTLFWFFEHAEFHNKCILWWWSKVFALSVWITVGVSLPKCQKCFFFLTCHKSPICQN